MVLDLLMISATEANPFWSRRRRRRRRRSVSQCNSSLPGGVHWVNHWQRYLIYSCPQGRQDNTAMLHSSFSTTLKKKRKKKRKKKKKKKKKKKRHSHKYIALLTWFFISRIHAFTHNSLRSWPHDLTHRLFVHRLKDPRFHARTHATFSQSNSFTNARASKKAPANLRRSFNHLRFFSLTQVRA